MIKTHEEQQRIMLNTEINKVDRLYSKILQRVVGVQILLITTE